MSFWLRNSAALALKRAALALSKAFIMPLFDWHKDKIAANTPVTASYRNTQNVRRFLTAVCGADFKFDRDFMAWIKDGNAKTMGDVAEEWIRRRQLK